MKPESPLHLYGEPVRRVHCVGVGGMGLGPLAIYLADCGVTVTGEDAALRDDIRPFLEKSGVSLESSSPDCDIVVYSSAINPDHPAFQTAQEGGCRIVRRGELLAEIVREKKLVAICGSHGKTTTTAMLVEVLRRSGFSADYVLGGLFVDPEVPPAVCAKSEWMIAEIDESDGTIGQFSPEITITVNLDWDHADHYRDLGDMKAMFASVFERTRGSILVNHECELSMELLRDGVRFEADDSAITFGAGGDFEASFDGQLGETMILQTGGRFALESLKVRTRGEFNVSNATAALAAGQLMGAEIAEDSLADFRGVLRRQSVLHDADGVSVVEDYAHHPTEVGALLRSLRDQVRDGGRLIVVFQPHRYSRTAQFKADFATALSGADCLYLLDVYGAGESPVEGGTSAHVLMECRRVNPQLMVKHLPHDGEIVAELDATVKTGDLVAFVGAGTVDQMARQWVESFRQEVCS